MLGKLGIVALEVLETAVLWRVEELTPRGLGNVVPWLPSSGHEVSWHVPTR